MALILIHRTLFLSTKLGEVFQSSDLFEGISDPLKTFPLSEFDQSKTANP